MQDCKVFHLVSFPQFTPIINYEEMTCFQLVRVSAWCGDEAAVLTQLTVGMLCVYCKFTLGLCDVQSFIDC